VTISLEGTLPEGFDLQPHCRCLDSNRSATVPTASTQQPVKDSSQPSPPRPEPTWTLHLPKFTPTTIKD